jgi:hypothetical protein
MPSFDGLRRGAVLLVPRDTVVVMETSAIEAAVSWWATALRSRIGTSTGDDRLDLVGALAAAPPLTPDEQERFKGALRELLTSRLASGAEVQLMADHGPHDELGDAYRAARPDAHGHSFPAKTYMRVTAELVEVRSGYRAPWETIYPAAPASTSM